MVDEKVADAAPQVKLESEVKVEGKEGRSRRPRQIKKSAEKLGDKVETVTTGKGKGNRNGQRYAPKKPTSEGEEEHEGEKAPVVVDGKVQLQVSRYRPRNFYTRLARLLFAGYTHRGAKWDHGEVEAIEIAAFGLAIGDAVMVADELKQANVGTIESINTEYHPVKEGREIPRVVVLLRKNKEWVATEDEALKKSGVWKRIQKKEEGEDTEKAGVEAAQQGA